MLNKNVILFAILVISASSVFAQETAYKIGAVGFYNLENLFDTLDTEDVNDTEFTPNGGRAYTKEVYYDKLDKLATVISEMGTETTPDGLAILGVSEIENRSVLEDLVKQTRIADRRYQIVHYESPDERGIDVGLLYNPKYFTVTSSQAINHEMYRDDGSRDYTRDVLFVSGEFDGESMHVLVNHWPSRGGGASAKRGRDAAALLCKNVIDSLQKVDPAAKIIIMGDLNDNPVDDSVKKVLAAKKDKNKTELNGIYNPYIKLYKSGYGSNAWRDTWSLFDQVMVSGGLVKGDKKEGYQFYQAKVFNKSYLVQKSGQYKGYPFRTYSGDKYQGGYSDHFPSYIFLLKEVKK